MTPQVEVTVKVRTPHLLSWRLRLAVLFMRAAQAVGGDKLEIDIGAAVTLHVNQ